MNCTNYSVNKSLLYEPHLFLAVFNAPFYSTKNDALDYIMTINIFNSVLSLY